LYGNIRDFTLPFPELSFTEGNATQSANRMIFPAEVAVSKAPVPLLPG
jgi:hypothetical protein